MSEIVSDENDKLNRCIKALHLKYIVAYIIQYVNKAKINRWIE